MPTLAFTPFIAIPERARLLLARAIVDEPPLLVFDHLDADLGHDGRIITPTQVWRPDGVHRIVQPLSVGRRRSELAS